jgi:hypothetical protein
MSRNWLWGLVLLLGAVVLGCGHPQVASVNRRVIASLRTAVSAKNLQWLEQNETMIGERHQSGAMGDAEFEEFQSIIAQARSGEWNAAEVHLVALAKAQRVTPDDLERIKPDPSASSKK